MKKIKIRILKKRIPSISSNMFSFEAPMTPVGTGPSVMAIPVVEFSRKGYIIRKVLT